MRQLGAALLGSLGAFLLSPSLLAEPQTRSTSEVSSSPGGTLSSLALRLSRELSIESEPLVVVGPLQTEDVELTSEARAALQEKLRLVLGSAVPRLAARSSEAFSYPEARSEARKRGLSLVYLSPSLRAGQLLLSVDAVNWPRSFWQRSRAPEGIVTAHLSLRAPIDAELRRFLPRPRALWSNTQRYSSPLRDVVALACGVTDEDEPTLVVVGRREITRGRFRGAHFVPEHRVAWNDLSPLAPTPLRSVIAGARFGSTGLEIGSSDRAYMIRLTPQLTFAARAPRALPLESGDCSTFTSTGLSKTTQACAWSTARPAARSSWRAPSEESNSLSTRTKAAWTDAAGIVHQLDWQVPSDGSPSPIELRSGLDADRSLLLRDVGTAIGFADLDGDGALELIASSAERDPTRDHLKLLSYDGSTLLPRAELQIPGVRALTVCPFFGTNPLQVIVATDNQLWVLS